MRKCAAGLLLGALLFTTTPSWAGDPNNEEALRRGYEADALFSQGQWDEAYEAFAAAEALAHSPVFVLYMAHCRRNAGRLLEAERLYQRVAGEKLSSEASPPFRDAIAEAEREVERIRGRIPTLRILAPASASIEIDGEPTAGPVVRLDPGPHRVVARSEAKQVERTVTLGEGSEVELPLDLGDAPRSSNDDSGGSIVPAVLAFAFGGAGIALGAVTGGVAASMAGDIKEGCVDGHCLAEDAGDLDTAQTLATVSTIGFIAGAAGLATGGVLLLARPGAEDTAWLEVHGSF